MTSILLVEDDVKIRASLLFQLQSWGYEASASGTAEGALSRLLPSSPAEPPDLLLTDVRLPGLSGVDMIRQLAEEGSLPATIIVSGEASMSETVEALKLGVHDFIEKPFTPERLRQSLAKALEHSSLRQRIESLESELGQRGQILGNSQVMQELRNTIERAAPTDARVLILGESGTGKELVADALHRGSPRASGPFIKLNCAAIPRELIEDELFGHVQGAYTDARRDKPGLFEEAHGGTLFLDEIGDMDLALQGRLLRVLEDGRVRRVGATKDRAVDVRIVAATHADLESAVVEGDFRQDLYFRLAHLVITVPSLRRREGDIRLLFEHFVKRAANRHRVRRRELDPAVFDRLEAHPWPGNVRELESLSERLVVFGADLVTADQLTPWLGNSSLSPDVDEEDPAILPLRDFRERSEKRYLRRVLEQTGWNVAAAARLLEIQRTHLHLKLTQLGLRRPTPES